MPWAIIRPRRWRSGISGSKSTSPRPSPPSEAEREKARGSRKRDWQSLPAVATFHRMSTATKHLLELSQKLPAEKVRELLDFAEFLLARSPARSPARSGNGATKGGRAWRGYIGGVKHGALAAGIDDELYGRPVH